MRLIDDYEAVIGIEVHCELTTETKMFCGCAATFGAPPNTQVCPVCLGMPGALPVLNGAAVDLAIKAGLAAHCAIAPRCGTDRKHYFYPDLPKAYQISQYDVPLCAGGYLQIDCGGGEKRIGITRIHIEEDAGKLIHTDAGTLIDCHRCGVPLIEIVSEPDIRSAEEAAAYVSKLRAVMMYAGVCDGRMQEGSLRADVNLSVRKRGDTALGTRTETKNLNSFTNIRKAVEYEYRRQVELLRRGGAVTRQTLRFDDRTGKTVPMRDKESAADYRFFPEPDLAPIVTDPARIERLRGEIPKLPDERKAEYVAKYALTAFDAEMITSERLFAELFEAAAERTTHPKLLANLLISEVMRAADPCGPAPLAPAHLAQVAQLLGDGAINSSVAKTVIAALLTEDTDAVAYVDAHDLRQIADPAALRPCVERAIALCPKAVADYRRGKTAASRAIFGKVMAETGGRGDPAAIERLLTAALNGEDE